MPLLDKGGKDGLARCDLRKELDELHAKISCRERCAFGCCVARAQRLCEFVVFLAETFDACLRRRQQIGIRPLLRAALGNTVVQPCKVGFRSSQLRAQWIDTALERVESTAGDLRPGVQAIEARADRVGYAAYGRLGVRRGTTHLV